MGGEKKHGIARKEEANEKKTRKNKRTGLTC